MNDRVTSLYNNTSQTMCFYTNSNFGGVEYCQAPHSGRVDLPLVDNAFSSHRVKPVSVRDVMETRAMSCVNARVEYSQTSTYANANDNGRHRYADIAQEHQSGTGTSRDVYDINTSYWASFRPYRKNGL